MSTRLSSFKHNYLNKPSLIMLFFGFAAGLPLMLIVSSLSLWLREAGIDRSTVTMFAWAALGYSFKFIWAPLVDTISLPWLSRRFGQRRGWLLLAQSFIMFAIICMALTNPANPNAVGFMAMAAVMLGFSSATQDIVIDAYRIESAPTHQQPVLSAMYVAGYRIGMIASGAGSLYLADFFGSTSELYSYAAWQKTYLIMAFLVLIAFTTTLIATEPNTDYDAKNLSILRKNNRIATLVLYSMVPLALYGVYYLLIKLLHDVFNMEVGTHSTIDSALLYYGTALLVMTPVLLIYFLIHQPVSLPTKTTLNDSSDQLRLFALFLLCAAVFVGAFRLVGIGLDGFDTESPLLGFVLEALRLMAALGTACVFGYILTQIKLVKTSVVKTAWVSPIADFFNRYGKKALLLLALISLYRISDIVAGNISNIFYQDLGFSKTDIANAVKFVGLIMTILGGFLGGLLSLRLNIMLAMAIGAIAACVTNLLFILLSHEPSLVMMYVAVIFDNLAAGLASAIFVAFLSALTSIRFTAVQYALLSSLMTLIPKVIGGYAGSIVDANGYAYFFMITFLIGLPVLLLIYLVNKHIMIDKFEL